MLLSIAYPKTPCEVTLPWTHANAAILIRVLCYRDKLPGPRRSPRGPATALPRSTAACMCALRVVGFQTTQILTKRYTYKKGVSRPSDSFSRSSRNTLMYISLVFFFRIIICVLTVLQPALQNIIAPNPSFHLLTRALQMVIP